jgi:hypothetical protein
MSLGVEQGREKRLDDKSRMKGDFHVRFCGSAGVRIPRATRPLSFYDRDLVLSITGNNIFKTDAREAASKLCGIGEVATEDFQNEVEIILGTYPTAQDMWNKLEKDHSL